MDKYTVKEGSTGILELRNELGRKAVYQPDCDLDKAQSLLYEFYELRTTGGVKIKDAFQRDGIDWFPTAVSRLYWGYFFQLVKYKPLADACIKGEKDFLCDGPGNFTNVVRAIKMSQGLPPAPLRKCLKKIYQSFLQFRNRLVVRRRGDILFFRYGLNDFRTREICADLRKKYQVTQAVGAANARRSLVKRFFDSQIYFLSDGTPGASFQVSLPVAAPAIHKAALCFAQDIINAHIKTYERHARLIRHYRYRLFAGIDDANFVYPILYAAQDAGMKTLGIQHAPYMRRHEAYIMRGIERYRWYDHVLVWGEYWKEVVLKHSAIFSRDFHIPASNKHSYDYSSLPKKGSGRTILVPYEFLADSIRVGWYMKQFISKGFKIYFKPRPDEPLEDQLRSYDLGEARDKIEIMPAISPQAMAEVDIVAGTQTTMLFDLLPYKKPVWILETPFRLLWDMVEAGLARFITPADMENIDRIYAEEMRQRRQIDMRRIYGEKPLIQAVEEYLAS